MVSKKLAIGLCAVLAASELVNGSAKPSVASSKPASIRASLAPAASASARAESVTSAQAKLGYAANSGQADKKAYALDIDTRANSDTSPGSGSGSAAGADLDTSPGSVPIPNSGPVAGSGSVAGSNAGSNAGTNSGSYGVEEDRQNLAFNVSPKDKVYDTHRVDDDEKFHAPNVAPNDKQRDAADPKHEQKLVEETTAEESRKGTKGSVILDDYDPSRLGVSANEAKNPKAKDPKAKEDKSGDPVDLKAKDVKPAAGKTSNKGNKEADAAEAVADNKASNAKAKAEQQQAEDENTQQKISTEEKMEAEQRKQQAEISESTTVKTDVTSEEDAAGCYKFGRLIGSATMIVVSEIGDKTFFIAALMAMRHPPLFVFSSSYSAMVIMTVLSMALGLILPSLLSRRVTTLIAALLFLVFGARMVREAWMMDKNLAATEELEEVEHDLSMADRTAASEKAEAGGYISEDSKRKNVVAGLKNLASLVFSPAWIQIFAMTFLGEWGDRSQIATVAMGAGADWAQALIGCLLGHFVTTAIAVMGGKIVANHLSLRTITFSGAVCFLLFAGFYFHDWLNQ